MKDYEHESAFDRDRRIQENVKLIRIMKNANAMAYRAMTKHFMDGTPIESTFDGQFTKAYFPSSEFFEKCFGKIIVTFIGDSTEVKNLCQVEPKQYLIDCFFGEPISMYGLLVPNKKKYIDKVNFVHKLLK